MSPDVASNVRDGLAKAMYQRVFSWIVSRINANLGLLQMDDGLSRARFFIGILDIFGFEQLKTNSFEQLCINYVNEMLQEQFNESVFAAERRLLSREGIA